MGKNVKRNPVDELADAFLERYRQGEHPSLSEYTQRYPELADEIREVFPALVMMHQVKEDLQELNGDADEPSFNFDLLTQQLGDYRLIREVGRGGMGVVYEAEQISLARQVALKVLPKQVLLDKKHKQRFVREAKAAARLHHTNIVPVFGVGEQDGIQYYVMQFIDGQGLDEILIELKRLREESQAGQTLSSTGQSRESAKQPAEPGNRKSADVVLEKDAVAQSVAQSLMSGRFERTVLFSDDEELPQVPSEFQVEHDTATGRLSDTQIVSRSLGLPAHSNSGSRVQSRNVYWQSVARIGQQAADALEYAHAQGIIHRDVKPGNLLLDTCGNVWVADFGLAKTADQQDLTQTGDILGTIRYMAPEQFDGHADARSDVYSLGITLYEMLALQPAFDERDRRKLVVQVTKETPTRLRSIDSTIPRDLETIVHKAIDRDPSHRYQTAGELTADLNRFLADEPIKARWISPITRFSRWCKRNPAVAVLSSTVVVLLISATVGASVAAIKFHTLANNLNVALGEAQKNLSLATTEQKRAEANLDLALTALDTVYLDAIGQEKLLGQTSGGFGSPTLRPTNHGFSKLEQELIRRGLGFYEQFAEQNEENPKASVHVAQAYYRVGLLQAGLAEHDLAAESYLKAITRYEDLLVEEPENAEHYVGLTKSIYDFALTKPDWNEAKATMQKCVKYVERGLAADSKNADLYVMRAWLNIDFGRLDNVALDLENAVRLDPENVDHYLKCGWWLCAGDDILGRDYDKAIKYAKRSVELAPDNPKTYTLLGFAYLNRDRTAEPALKYFNRAIEIQPNYVQARAYRARIYREIFRDYRQGLQEANTIIALDPTYDRGFTERALAHSNLGEHQAALRDIERARELAPLSIHIAWRSGHIYHAKGDYERAVEAFTELIELRPGYLLTYFDRASSYVELEEYENALRDLNTAEKLSSRPGHLRRFHYQRGKIFKIQKNYADAIEEFTKAVTAGPDAASYSQRADCALKLGQTQVALESLSQAIEQRPFYENYRRRRLSVAWKRGQFGLVMHDYAVAEILARFTEFGFNPDSYDFTRVKQLAINSVNHEENSIE